ncbi:unnamed protein product [Dovyalis caffra]|uniref:Uncharacterized protein n=1 Tax=Dovyalis caffra TaxID=77055 RepID=A0AAV1RNV7_9ROSI|nr:unnamed protein product [Dovyalis caffra]
MGSLAMRERRETASILPTDSPKSCALIKTGKNCHSHATVVNLKEQGNKKNGLIE